MESVGARQDRRDVLNWEDGEEMAFATGWEIISMSLPG